MEWSSNNGWTKECSSCKTIFIGANTSDDAERKLGFYFAQDTAKSDGFYSRCKKCVSHYQRNKREDRECDAEALLEQQNGLCAICAKSLSFHRDKFDAKVTAYVDHSHETNRVRGILCVRCNSMLGSKEWLLKALAYVEKHGD